MSRPVRIALISTGAVVLIAVLAVIAGVEVARSDWLREKFRERIVAEAEKATGGRVEIGAFKLDWSTLTAEVDNLTIHGSEPAGVAPLVTVKRVTIGFRIVSLMRRDFDIARLDADTPRVHLLIQADGATNIPQPKTPLASIPGTILDLRVGKFDLTDGAMMAERGGSRTVTPWNLGGENLTAHVNFDAAGRRYDSEISAAPLEIAWDGLGRIVADVRAKASMEKNRIVVSEAQLKTGGSEFDFTDAVLDSFNMPVITAKYKAAVSLADADRIFKLVSFQHSGTVQAEGGIRFVSPHDYTLSAAVRGTGIGYGKVRNVRVAGNLTATPGNVLVSGLRLNTPLGELNADGQVRNLKDFHLSGQLRSLDAKALAQFGGMAAPPYDAMLSGRFDATGQLSETDFHRLVAEATLVVSPASGGEPLSGEVSAKFNGPANSIELGPSWLALPKTRVDFSGVWEKQLQVKLRSQDVGELQPVLQRVSLPVKLENGSAAFEGTVSGPPANPRISGHAALQNAVYQGQRIDSVAGDFTAMETAATVTNAAIEWGNLRARVSGSIGLSHWKPSDTSPVNASFQIANADIPKLLAMAGRSNLPISGTLNATGQLTGTPGAPKATADLRLSRGQIYGEPFDSVTGRAQYLNGGAQLLTAAIDAGRKRVNITARFEHSPATFLGGKLTFNVSSNTMALSRIALVRRREPDIKGNMQVRADGTVEITRAGVNVVNLNADVSATALGQGPRNFGNLRFIAETKNDVMTVRLVSDAARAAIRGDATVRLAGDYPVAAKVTFANVGLSAVVAAMLPERPQSNFDGSAAGEIAVRGPMKNPSQITATADIPQFEVHPLSITGGARNIANLELKNTQPIRLALANSTVRVESAHFQAPSTDLDVTGTVSLRGANPVNLKVQGNMNLALAQTLNPDLTTKGEVLIDASLRGSLNSPDFSGRAEMRNADFHYAGFANGLTNANATIAFNGSRANIQSFRAESGGGTVDLSGFATLIGGQYAFRLEAKTKAVRIRYPEGLSTVSDSDVTLAGTSQRSEASGTVVIHRIAINPKSDVSAILESTTEPLQTPEASKSLLANMNLDVQIETAPDVAFETSIAQSLDADANLRLRGTVTNPAVLGRINITQGELVFFGNKYTINQGSVSFLNPARIDPILNVDLQTRARGVTVTLTLSGPINKLNLSYRSDPPLQWADIIALLATGRSPTDPTLVSQNTGQSQNLQQLGASGLISQAIQNPVSGNLQRFFGVSRIKIDPQLIGITGSPEARLTIEQQVTPDLLFTYISDVSSTSTQLFQVEWDFNRKWAAILTREENGYVGLNFAYKKRFK